MWPSSYNVESPKLTPNCSVHAHHLPSPLQTLSWCRCSIIFRGTQTWHLRQAMAAGMKTPNVGLLALFRYHLQHFVRSCKNAIIKRNPWCSDLPGDMKGVITHKTAGQTNFGGCNNQFSLANILCRSWKHFIAMFLGALDGMTFDMRFRLEGLLPQQDLNSRFALNCPWLGCSEGGPCNWSDVSINFNVRWRPSIYVKMPKFCWHSVDPNLCQSSG